MLQYFSKAARPYFSLNTRSVRLLQPDSCTKNSSEPCRGMPWY